MAVRRQRASAQRLQHLTSAFSFLLAFILILSSLLPGATSAASASTGPDTLLESPANSSAGALLLPPQQPAATWTICASGCDFQLIQTAIDHSGVSDGDTLMVMDPIHTEKSIEVDKDVTIRGQGPQNTIVQATNTPPGSSTGGGRLFRIASGTTATIAEMTVRHGFAEGYQSGIAISDHTSDDGDAQAESEAEGYVNFWGAGIAVYGNLTLDRSVVSDNYIVITSTMQSLARATAPITATAEATAVAFNQLYANGAGIYNTGNLTVTNSTITDNEIYVKGVVQAWAEASGGVITKTAIVATVAQVAGTAIYNGGSMWLSNSTVSGNRATTSSVAQAMTEAPSALSPLAVPPHIPQENLSVGKATGSQSAYLQAQWTPNGRRILSSGDDDGFKPSLSDRTDTTVYAPHLRQDESTAQAQINSQAVAGIYNAGTAIIRFSTISDNSAITEAEISADETTVTTEEIGGLFNETGASLSLDNTIFAAQAQGANCGQTAGSSTGYNLDSDGSCALASIGDRSNVEALLSPLGDNGGPTPTHTLQPGSPAVDAGDPACPGPLLGTDQRGVARPVDGDGDGSAVCDIGAVEAQFETDLALVKSGPPQAVTVGQTVAFTITVTNNGPRGAGYVVVTDTMPASLTYLGSSIACGVPDGQNRLSCSLPDIAANGSHTFHIQGHVAADAAAASADGTVTITNTAEVAAFGPDLTTANDEAQATATVDEGFADLKISKFGPSGTTLQAGEPFTYTLIVDNLGPAAARGVQIKDNILSSGSFTVTQVVEDPDRPDSCSIVGTPTGDVLQCQLNEPLEPQGTPGSSARWLVQVAVAAQEAAQVENIVEVATGPGTYTAEGVEWTSGTPDAQLDNNETKVFIDVEATADLQLSGSTVGQVQIEGQPGNTFTLTPGQVTAGASLTYTLTVYNAGPSTAENVRLDHYLPAGLQSLTVTAEQGSCDTTLPADPTTPLTCELGTLAAGQTINVLLTAQASPALPDGTALNSHALVGSDAFDPQNQNNNIVLNSSANSHADLTLDIVQQPQAALIGQPLIYTISVLNAGPSDAATAVISDVLPAGVTGAVWYCEAAGGASCRESGAGDVYDRVSLPAGSDLIYTVEATVSSCALQDNVATVSGGNDPYLQNNRATATNTTHCAHLPLVGNVTPAAAPDLVVTELIATIDDVEVVIENVGRTPVVDPFWVDVYIAPTQAPQRANQVWQHLGDEGLVWGVSDVPLAPGERLALKVGDAYYAAESSYATWPLTPGTHLYAQVDSFNAATIYGAVLESHEIIRGPYNNISGPVTPQAPQTQSR